MFNFIDLFAGIGGLRIPFDEIGGNCVFSSEKDNFAQITYEANFNHIPNGDITTIPPKEIPKHNLLLAGFPCQPFSQAGLKKGFEDTRGTLFFYVANIIDHHRPEVILLENVKRLKTHDQGNTLNTIYKVLEKLGYKVTSQVLNAKDFGLPQNRERIFIIATLNQTDSFIFPYPLNKNTRVGDILESKVADKYTISDKLWRGHIRRKEEHQAKGFGFGYSLFNRNSPYTSTMSARYYKDGSEILIAQSNKNPRKITPREAARLQGFPESFKILVSDAQAYKQFGNSVSVPVVRQIAKNLKYFLSEKNHKKLKPVKISRYIPVKGISLPC